LRIEGISAGVRNPGVPQRFSTGITAQGIHANELGHHVLGYEKERKHVEALKEKAE
jgi:hypothetical protein